MSMTEIMNDIRLPRGREIICSYILKVFSYCQMHIKLLKNMSFL